jgi:hypothetical protein
MRHDRLDLPDKKADGGEIALPGIAILRQVSFFSCNRSIRSRIALA